jgi:hypothetical protein
MVASGWFLGPISDCRPIPAPIRGMAVNRESPGTVVRSLAGTTTRYQVPAPRTWRLAWPTMTEDELTYLRAAGLGLTASPLRLVDPMVTNLLPVQVASGGSYRRDVSRFTVTGGSGMSWVAISDPPPGVPVRGGVSWVRNTTAAATLTLSDVSDRVPLLGRGQRWSCWVRGTAIAVGAAMNIWDAAGALTTTAGSSITLDPVAWRYLEQVYTPTTGKISTAPVLSIAAGQAVSTVVTTGWQMGWADVMVSGAPWTEGGGAPEVVVTALEHAYARWRRYALALTLAERKV